MFLLKIAITLIVLFIAFSLLKKSIQKRKNNKNNTDESAHVEEKKDEHENLGV